jgi:hypothetical protein
MKVTAEIEIGAMAASAGIVIGAAIFTGGFSALLDGQPAPWAYWTKVT